MMLKINTLRAVFLLITSMNHQTLLILIRKTTIIWFIKSKWMYMFPFLITIWDFPYPYILLLKGMAEENHIDFTVNEGDLVKESPSLYWNIKCIQIRESDIKNKFLVSTLSSLSRIGKLQLTGQTLPTDYFHK